MSKLGCKAAKLHPRIRNVIPTLAMPDPLLGSGYERLQLKRIITGQSSVMRFFIVDDPTRRLSGPWYVCRYNSRLKRVNQFSCFSQYMGFHTKLRPHQVSNSISSGTECASQGLKLQIA